MSKVNIPEKKKLSINEIQEKYDKDNLQFLEDTKGENVLQVVLRGHLYIERELTILLKKALENPGELVNNKTFYGHKLNIACAIGVLSIEDKKSYQIIGSIRNDYAHTWGFELKQHHLDRLVKSFEGRLKERYENVIAKKMSSDDLISNLRNLVTLMWTHLCLTGDLHLYISYLKQSQLKEYELFKKIEKLERELKEETKQAEELRRKIDEEKEKIKKENKK